MKKWLWMVPALMLGIGYTIAADTNPPVEEPVAQEEIVPDQPAEPTLEEPVISDLHPQPVPCREGQECSE